MDPCCCLSEHPSIRHVTSQAENNQTDRTDAQLTSKYQPPHKNVHWYVMKTRPSTCHLISPFQILSRYKTVQMWNTMGHVYALFWGLEADPYSFSPAVVICSLDCKAKSGKGKRVSLSLSLALMHDFIGHLQKCFSRIYSMTVSIKRFDPENIFHRPAGSQ